MDLRDDLQLIYRWIPADSHVLDLGCGGGELLAALTQHKNCTGYGIEIDPVSVQAAVSRGINVIQADLEHSLDNLIQDRFDIIVLSQTIQAMRNTETILRSLTRMGKQAIVSFPNFGYWKNRLQITFGGKMPVSERMPYQWYDTPNIHWCTLKDFERLCAQNNIRIMEKAVMSGSKQITFMHNLLGSIAFYRIG